jgi:hypothetical integral membrane protein (TIGR02206 family)
VSIWVARRGSESTVLVLTRGLALLIIAAWLGEFLADAVLGIWSAQYDLPLQLTDALAVVSALALLTRRQRLAELCYLWAMTAALQAVVTPDLGYAFPSIFYFTYFIYHGGAIVGGCVLVFGLRLYPRRGAVARAYVAALAWACVAGVADLITGGNYMYLREKPEHGSLLNIMGPWPWYVLATAVLVAPALLIAARALAMLVERVDLKRAPSEAASVA